MKIMQQLCINKSGNFGKMDKFSEKTKINKAK